MRLRTVIALILMAVAGAFLIAWGTLSLLAVPRLVAPLVSWAAIGTGVACVVYAPILALELVAMAAMTRARNDERQGRRDAEEQVRLLRVSVGEMSREQAARIEVIELSFAERMAELRRLAMDTERQWLQGERAQALVDEIPAPLVVPDQHGEVFVLVNRAFANFLGVPVGRVTGRSWREFIVSADLARIDQQRQAHQDEVNAGTAAIEETGHFTTTYTHAKGHEVTLRWSPGPLADGEPAYYIARGQP